MRLIVPVASLLVALFSIAIDQHGAAYDGAVCALGLCRFDQIAASVDTERLNTGNIQTVIGLNPSDPLLWATYGELLAVEGKDQKAAEMYDRAVALGPHMAAVQMRAANFDFTHNRIDHALLMTHEILAATGGFDQILFSYLTAFHLPATELLEKAIPPDPRAAQSWLAWLRSHGSTADLMDTWRWMSEQNLADEPAAVGLTQTLFGRKAYREAQGVWAGWQGKRDPAYLNPERIWNGHFAHKPTASPFDWSIVAPPSVQIEQADGLQIRFSGKENLSLATVRQYATVPGSRYTFTAEAQAQGLSTDQRPFFHLWDPAHPGALDLEIPLDEGTPTVGATFLVPAGTSVVEVQLERRRSDHFDNKLAGTVHLKRVSLRPH